MARHAIALLIFFSLWTLPELSSAQSIGIFLDPAGAHCSGPVNANPIATLYVIGQVGGEVAAGVHGCQFRIVGVPSTWTESNAFWATEIPGAITVGHPFFPRPNGTGVGIAFPECYRDGVPAGDEGPFLIGTIRLLLAPTPNDVHLRVTWWPAVPSDPHCPFFNDCTFPGFEKHCAAGGEAFLNNTGPDCDVAVAPVTWGRLKSLYE
jgi:hypothetical protein